LLPSLSLMSCIVGCNMYFAIIIIICILKLNCYNSNNSYCTLLPSPTPCTGKPWALLECPTIWSEKVVTIPTTLSKQLHVYNGNFFISLCCIFISLCQDGLIPLKSDGAGEAASGTLEKNEMYNFLHLLHNIYNNTYKYIYIYCGVAPKNRIIERPLLDNGSVATNLYLSLHNS
jgi:hypothetical protein